jgi:ABC-type nitrate/sulfonate/bicarbonate transport system substrate-binding protein
MSKFSLSKSLAAVGVAAALVLGGCGGSSDSSGSDEKLLRVYYASSLDPGDIADLIGLAKTPTKVGTLKDDSAVIAGLLRGSAEVGNVDMQAALEAAGQGIPIRIIYVSEATPEYVLVSRSDISSLDELGGKRVGYHSRGSQTEVFVNELIKAQAPSIYDDVKFVALENSPRRAQALVGKKLDATSLESIDYAQLQKQGKFNLLGSWKDLSGDSQVAIGNVWITTEKLYQKNKSRLRDFVEALQSGYNEFYTDEQKWLDVGKEKLPDIDSSLLPAVYAAYKQIGLYPAQGKSPLTEEIFTKTEKFYRDHGGEWDEPISSDIVKFDLVDAAVGAGSSQ